MIRFRVLGSVELTGPGGEEITSVLSQPKRTALLAFLAAATPRGFHRRDKIVGMFWPKSDHERARASLRRSVHFLRRSLGEETIVGRGDEELSLAESLVWSDVETFEGALEGGDPETALELYRGDLLDGFFLSGCPEFEKWLDGERERLRERAAGAAWTVAHRLISRGRLTDAERTGQRALDLVPTDEDEVQRFILALAGAGDRAAAVRFYEKFAAVLKEQLDLEPSAASKSVAEAIRIDGVSVGARREPAESPREPSETSRSWPLAEGRADRPSIAALPWVSRSGRKEDVYFTDGIHAEILTRLSLVGGLRVIARQSVVRFRESPRPAREVAAELDVRYLLEAGLLRSGDAVRIDVRLVDAHTDDCVWAEAFDRALTMENLLRVQSEIAQEVATALEAVLSPKEQDRIRAPVTDNLVAYDLYLLGRHRSEARSAQNLRDSIRYFGAALEQDPGFALAWAGLADAWTARPWYEPVPSREAHARGREAALRALDLDDGLPEAHTALGALTLYYEWAPEEAEGHLVRAIDLNPNHAPAHHFLGLALWARGLRDRSLQSLQEGVRLNPLGNNFHYSLANLLYDAGRPEEASAAYRKAEGLHPPVPYGLVHHCVFSAHEGRSEEARRVIQRWGGLVAYPHPPRLETVVNAIHDDRYTGEALAVLEEVRRATGLRAGDLAVLYLNLDSPAEALRIVQEAIAERHAIVPFFNCALFRRAPRLADPEIVAALRAVLGPTHHIHRGEGGPPHPSQADEATPLPYPAASTMEHDRTVSPDASAARREKGPRKLRWRTAKFGGVILAGLAWFLLGHPRTPSYPTETRIAVLPPMNRTGNPALDPLGYAAVDLITHGLDWAELGRAVPLTEVMIAALAASGSVDPRLALQGSWPEETGAELALLGAYYVLGDSVSFHLRLVDRGNRTVAEVQPAVGHTEAVTDVLERLRFNAVTSVAGILAPDDVQLDFLSPGELPKDLDTYRLLWEAVEVYATEGSGRAISLFEEVARRDSAYLVPVRWLVALYWDVGRHAEADSLCTLLGPRMGQLTGQGRIVALMNCAAIRGQHREALASARRLLEYSSVYQIRVGFHALDLNRPQEAVEAFSSYDPHGSWLAAELADANARHLALAYHWLGDHETELRVVREARREFPEYRQLAQAEVKALAALGRVQEAEERIEEGIALLPAGRTPAYFLDDAARELDEHGNPAEAHRLWERLLGWHSRHPPAEGEGAGLLRERAQTLLFLGRNDEARDVLQTLVQESPEDCPVLGMLGVSWARLGDQAQAAQISEALRTWPGRVFFAENTVWRANIAAAVGNPEEAISLLNQAIEEGAAFRTLAPHDSPYLESLRDHPGFKEFLRPKG